MFLCRLTSCVCTTLKVIGASMQHLEELFLDYLDDDNGYATHPLVAGCPKLKRLHVGCGLTLKSVEFALLGLHNLIDFKHPQMMFAVEKIIEDGMASRVSAIRYLYFSEDDLCKNNLYFLSITYHLENITTLYMFDGFGYFPSYAYDSEAKRLLTNFSEAISRLTQLTELTWPACSSYKDTIYPILQTVGHQLKLLDLRCNPSNCSKFDILDQCRELRVLRLDASQMDEMYSNDHSYGCDLQEEFNPFHNLEELYLNQINCSNFKPALLTSLIASPVLRDLKLVSVPIFTDDIVEAAFSHVNEDEEQLAFTSLRKLKLDRCDAITNYLENIVTHERVPLEVFVVKKCVGLSNKDLWNMWNLERFELEFEDVADTDESDDEIFELDSDSDSQYKRTTKNSLAGAILDLFGKTNP